MVDLCDKLKLIGKWSDIVHSITFTKLSKYQQHLTTALYSAIDDVLEAVYTELDDCIEVAKRECMADDLHKFLKPNSNQMSWKTTCQLFNLLVHLKHKLSRYKLNWKFVHDFVATFSLLIEFTDSLQTESYIIGDYYSDWLQCELELSEIMGKNNIAALLHSAMGKKKDMYFTEDKILAGLYLDPRFNFTNSPLLTESQKYVAKVCSFFETQSKVQIVNVLFR